MDRRVSEPYVAFSADTSDDEARRLAAQRLGVPAEHVEVERNSGCVLAWVAEGESDHTTANPGDGYDGYYAKRTVTVKRYRIRIEDDAN